MIPDAFPQNLRDARLDPAIMVPPLLWLVSAETDAISGCRAFELFRALPFRIAMRSGLSVQAGSLL
jgi:hypothetical protein